MARAPGTLHTGQGQIRAGYRRTYVMQSSLGSDPLKAASPPVDGYGHIGPKAHTPL